MFTFYVTVRISFRYVYVVVRRTDVRGMNTLILCLFAFRLGGIFRILCYLFEVRMEGNRIFNFVGRKS